MNMRKKTFSTQQTVFNAVEISHNAPGQTSVFGFNHSLNDDCDEERFILNKSVLKKSLALGW